ncbi:MAG: hypothetical protein GY830_10360, partial [Bacteroidetes bacterium]|nr:hypothetical protein [Bacteroidota bacterium]
MAFIRKRKQGNNVYAHEVTSYRDPLTKKVKQKTRYLGAIDPTTGNIIPANSRSKKNKIFLDFGNSFIIKEFLHKKGLYTIINNVFKEI